MPSRAAGSRDGRAAGATKTFTSVLLLARVFQDPDDGLFYIESPHLDIISAGHTAGEARAVFDEAIRLTLGDWSTDGVLEQRLVHRGFAAHRQLVAGYELVLFTPQGVEVETQFQPHQALPTHYSIQSVPYNVNTGVACMA